MTEEQRDAMRYRWLRQRFDAAAAYCAFNTSDTDFNSWCDVMQNHNGGAALDAAIDKAINAQNSDKTEQQGKGSG